MSVGKMPSRNLVERAWRASWMEATLTLANTSWRDSRADTGPGMADASTKERSISEINSKTKLRRGMVMSGSGW